MRVRTGTDELTRARSASSAYLKERTIAVEYVVKRLPVVEDFITVVNDIHECPECPRDDEDDERIV